MARPKRKIPWLDERNGRFYVFWYDETRRRTERLSLRTADEAEAKDRYIAFLQEGRSILRGAPDSGLSVSEVIDCYLREHVRVNPETGEDLIGDSKVKDRYRQFRSGTVLKEFWGDAPLASIDIPASRRYAAARAAHKPSAGPSTVRRELTALVAAANHSLLWKRIKPEEMPQVELPPHAPVQEAKFLTKDQIAAVISATRALDDIRPCAFTVLAYMAGARRKSIERLTRSQVDLNLRRLALTPAGVRTTKKRAPTVPISDDMALEIRKLMIWSKSDYLFGSANYYVHKKLGKVMEQVGIPEDRRSPHVLRHSRATHMLQDGASLWQVAKLLGDTVQTVEKVYGHHCPDYMGGQSSFGSLSGVLS